MAGVAVLQHEIMAGVGDLQPEGADEGNSTVWIGFMDIVPVIGAVKESVEFVLALYEGNSEEIKEKEKALDDIVMQLTQSGYKAAAADTTKCYNVKEVPMLKIIEHMMEGSRNLNLTSAQKVARWRKAEEIRRDMEQKLRNLNQLLPEQLREQLTRSEKGEHVFNNNILKFHLKVLRDFIKGPNKIYSLRGYESIEQTLNELGKHTLSPHTAGDIQTNMVVHFDSDEVYVNANAITYGKFSRALREAFSNVLGFHDPEDQQIKEAENKQWLTLIVEYMNNNQIYVDQYAKVKWIGNNQTRQRRFEEVRDEVANMYSTGRGLNWCADIMRVVEPLFNSK
ncbi:uncharacterized protein LOC132860431 [Tachysurus vachellii]|uniref:uncharacterized protein LOC132860431 n=1 Tax=Tachysurus vachellii TaxID=175792 RepID=UPI00296B254F|nr:uncharacterized protein LOC132860431 [Tachysurus vachellii]